LRGVHIRGTLGGPIAPDPDGSNFIAKRVIGIPGDTITWRNGRVHVNAQKADVIPRRSSRPLGSAATNTSSSATTAATRRPAATSAPSPVDASAGSGDAAARLQGLVSAIQDEIAANEAGFRSLLQLSIAQSPSAQPTVASIRGERRLQWIEQALEPIAGELDERSRQRLANALMLCVGAEAFVVLRDLCGLEPAEAQETLCWAAVAMLASATSDRKRGYAPETVL
jgi:hypothetical protein